MLRMSKVALAAVIWAIMAGSGAQALPNTAFSARALSAPNLLQKAGIAQKKAATKSWFKRKGNQTANWFNRQKNKIERKLAD